MEINTYEFLVLPTVAYGDVGLAIPFGNRERKVLEIEP